MDNLPGQLNQLPAPQYLARLHSLMPMQPFPPSDRIKTQLMDEADLGRTLDRMAHQIVEALFDESGKRFALVGLQTRGVPLAHRLAARVEALEGVQVPVGVLDATMYRDDVRLRGKPSIVRRTDILFDVNDCHIVLVDDVLYTGRSARAALDALMDIGRPASVRFLCIVDRGLRELPVTADIVGLSVPTLPDERVRVRLHEMDDREGVWLVGVEGVTSNE